MPLLCLLSAALLALLALPFFTDCRCSWLLFLPCPLPCHVTDSYTGSGRCDSSRAFSGMAFGCASAKVSLPFPCRVRSVRLSLPLMACSRCRCHFSRLFCSFCLGVASAVGVCPCLVSVAPLRAPRCRPLFLLSVLFACAWAPPLRLFSEGGCCSDFAHDLFLRRLAVFPLPCRGCLFYVRECMLTFGVSSGVLAQLICVRPVDRFVGLGSAFVPASHGVFRDTFRGGFRVRLDAVWPCAPTRLVAALFYVRLCLLAGGFPSAVLCSAFLCVSCQFVSQACVFAPASLWRVLRCLPWFSCLFAVSRWIPTVLPCVSLCLVAVYSALPSWFLCLFLFTCAGLASFSAQLYLCASCRFVSHACAFVPASSWGVLRCFRWFSYLFCSLVISYSHAGAVFLPRCRLVQDWRRAGCCFLLSFGGALRRVPRRFFPRFSG